LEFFQWGPIGFLVPEGVQISQFYYFFASIFRVRKVDTQTQIAVQLGLRNVTHSKERSGMSEYERMVLMAEDELTQYSTDARKIEKLRRKLGISTSIKQRQDAREQLETEMPKNVFTKAVMTQRQSVALPFWGIAGLGLLLGISSGQSIDFMATMIGGTLAIALQKWGWSLEARRILLETLNDLDGPKVEKEISN
jgi:hypothetical protein